MKKTKNIIVSFCLIAFFSLFLFSCEQATFENTSWATAGKTCAEISADVDNSIDYMMNEINIPLTYVTTTTYKFFDTEDNAFSAKTVEKTTTSAFSRSNTPNATAKFVTETRENGTLTSIKEETYVRSGDDEGFIYTQLTNYSASGDVLGAVFRDRQLTWITDFTFDNLLSDIIFVLREDEASVALEKTFEDIKYYKLQPNATNLEKIQQRFFEKDDLSDNPELFAFAQKDDHYVLPFSVEYGLTPLDYVSYFAVNYSLGNSNLLNSQNWEVYLSVSSTTRLKAYGNDMPQPSAPENANDFIAATFDNVVKTNEHFVVYKQMLEGENYAEYSVQTKADNSMLVEVKKVEDGLSATSYYYIEPLDESYVVFDVNSITKTYTASSLDSADFPFLKLDYSLALFTKTSTGDYQYGSETNFYLLSLQNDEVYSIADGRGEGVTHLLILNFSAGKNATFILNIGELVPADSE